ncbi:MAG: DUF3300 domain-containing protein [Terriglobales bacterium]|jgi:hypothetical protein
MKVAQQIIRKWMTLVCITLMVPGDTLLRAQESGQEQAKISNEQLDSLVAPIALYPDPLLAQTLACSTYPLEIIQLQQWLVKNKSLKDKALADAVQKQDWDASVQAMAAFPDLVKQLSENIKWTTDLGNAFLAQQNDVMDAVQRMRVKAKDNGNLKSTEQQKVETKVIESKSVVVIQPSSPEVIYVPSYNPTVVYGAPAYPYPPIAYPPPGYYAAGMAISFGVGMAMGAAWGGCCGWNAGWGGGNNNIYVNRSNNFVNNSNRNYNRQSVNRGNGNSWQHNPQHRGGAPYSNGQVASKYNGTTRGSSAANRQANARQNIQQSGGRTQAGARDRSGQVSQSGLRDGGGRGASAGTMDRGNRSGGSGGGDRVGNRSVSPSSGSRGSGAFGGSGGGTSGSSARASSQRGASSFGGGRSGGGASRGGGSRGGGGGRRR